MAAKYPKSKKGYLNKEIWDNIEQFRKAWETMLSLSTTEMVTHETFPYEITRFQWMNLAGLYNSANVNGFGNIDKIFENANAVAPIGKKVNRKKKLKKSKRLNRNIWRSIKDFSIAWDKTLGMGKKLKKGDFPELNQQQFASLSSYYSNNDRDVYDKLIEKETALEGRNKEIQKERGRKEVSKFLQKTPKKQSSSKKSSKFNYKEYLNSPHWRVFRDSYRKTSYYKAGCAVCALPAYCVHHRNYDNLTRETVLDVMPLCNNCHMKMHGFQTGHHYTSKKMLKKQETLLLCDTWEKQMSQIDRYYKTVDGR